MTTSPSRKTWGVLLFLAAAVLLYIGASLARFAFTPAKPGSQETSIIEVHRGDSPAEITRMLQQKGAISDTRLFSWLGRMTRSWRKIKSGEYEVSGAMTPLELLGTLSSGVSINHPLTVREGENMYEIADSLEEKGLGTKERFLALSRSPKFIASLGFKVPLPQTLEGYLYPETYFINRSMSVEDIIRQMVKRFIAVWAAFDGQEKTLGLTRHEVVTLASIVEKETGAPEERPLISSVFHNRLKKRMRLQSDPTTIYGMWERYTGKIHKSDLLAPSPWNTYTVSALPIGPISNPGREALTAALNPATSDLLFFVSKNDGTHEFNKTFEAHDAAVTRLQKDPKAREGKSWRDLKNRTPPTPQAPSNG